MDFRFDDSKDREHRLDSKEGEEAEPVRQIAPGKSSLTHGGGDGVVRAPGKITMTMRLAQVMYSQGYLDSPVNLDDHVRGIIGGALGKRDTEEIAPRRTAPVMDERDQALEEHAGIACGMHGHELQQAPVQQKADPAAAKRRKEEALLTAGWMDAAVRPDLHEAPVQRKRAGEERERAASSLSSPAPASGGRPLPEAVRAEMEAEPATLVYEEHHSRLYELAKRSGPKGVQTYLNSLAPDPRVQVSALLGIDLTGVSIQRDTSARDYLDSIAASGAAVGTTIYLRPDLSGPDEWELICHELVHAAQVGDSSASPQNTDAVAPPDSRLEAEAEHIGNAIASYQPMPAPAVAGGASAMVLRGKGKIIGWIVKVGERKLIKKTAIYSEKQMAKLLAKGYNILVRDGRQVAKRIANKAWGKNVLHHTGHLIKKTGKMGLPHYQPLKKVVGKAGEKGWHVFYSAVAILFFAEDATASAIYEDKYPGKSIAHYLTVTQYVGEDSWLSYLDWVNPLELVAIGGDIGRSIDRETSKELKAVVFTRPGPNGSVQTYEVNPQGQLVRVVVVNGDGKRKEFSAAQYYEFLGNSMDKLPQSKEGSKDGSHHKNFAKTFDAEYKLCYSKQGSSYERATGWLYLPAEELGQLTKHGPFYVYIRDSIGYAYVIVPANFRAVLDQPGFLLNSGEVKQYTAAPDKVRLLETWLEQRYAAGIMDKLSDKLGLTE